MGEEEGIEATFSQKMHYYGNIFAENVVFWQHVRGKRNSFFFLLDIQILFDLSPLGGPIY